MSNCKRIVFSAVATFTLFFSVVEISSNESQTVQNSDFEKTVLPFFSKHCFRCHGKEKQEGDLRLDTLTRDFVEGSSIEQWSEVIEKINAGEMPPKDQPGRPSAKASSRIVEWIAARMKEGETARLAKRERVSFHRLTREEYANTIYDLLGVKFDVADPSGLIEDDNWHGFQRIGSVLSLSAPHIEKYFAAAEAILAEAYPEKPPESFFLRKNAPYLVGGPKTYGDKKYKQLKQSGLWEKIRLDLWPGQQVSVKPPRGPLEVAGQYRIRVQLSGIKSTQGRAPHIAFYSRQLDRMLFERDIVAPEGKPIIVEFETHLPAGFQKFMLGNDVPGPLILSRLGNSRHKSFFSLKDGYIPWQLQMMDEEGEPLYPCLIVDWVEWNGPVVTKDVKLKRGSYMPSENNNNDRVRAGLTKFAARAFRRPLRFGEIEKYELLVKRQIVAGADMKSAVKTGMLAMLCSKDFLYLVEGSQKEKTTKLNDWELASRLSYFLWSTMPDDELFDLARMETLHRPKILRSQLARMLADPKAKRFAEAFPRQWLQLIKVGMFPPDKELYPDYDKYLEKSMVAETTEFFGEVLKRNLSLREFLASKWTMVNSRLALHYGIPGITEDRFQRVPLKPEHHRGGILTHASVLSLTSDGTRHRPVHRGVWLMESILGESPPPPPANVDPIAPNPVDALKSTIRMQIDAHKKKPTCASCHLKIDPLGLAFDSYDAIGRWRSEEVVPTGIGANPKVDASGTLPDGRSFSNTVEFQKLLIDDIDKFNAGFVKKLATFALRRTMTIDDRIDLAKIAAKSKTTDYRLRDLVEALAHSDLFHNR